MSTDPRQCIACTSLDTLLTPVPIHRVSPEPYGDAVVVTEFKPMCLDCIARWSFPRPEKR